MSNGKNNMFGCALAAEEELPGASLWIKLDRIPSDEELKISGRSQGKFGRLLLMLGLALTMSLLFMLSCILLVIT
ncbi:MAG: hypothetical protein ABSG67_04095 [Thermoguttaceae bacterium]|jgi:hypothetical protein